MIKEKLKKIAFFRKLQKMLMMRSSKNYALKKNGYNVICEIDQAMQKNQIECFIDFGTLLGIVREGQILSHDIDIDFGVLNADAMKKRKINRVLKEMGYLRTERHEYENDIKEESYQKGNNKVDFFYYEKDKQGVFCYVFCRIDGHNYKSLNEISAGVYRYNMDIKLERKIINGKKYTIPSNPEKLLSMKYGKTWKTPNKYWHYWYDANVEVQDKTALWIEEE